MNKNPFVPQPSYTPQQPPLPPGPPPPQPAQPDYSAYWAAAAQQQQQQHAQAPAVAAYNPQWSAPQPPRPPAEQSALYANYGYGGHNAHWQQQQRHNMQQFHQPPPPVVQPPPPPPQPAYNPYQPTAGYPQPYVPQAIPVPQPMLVQTPYAHPPPPPQPQPQQYFPQHVQQQQQQQHQQRHTHNVHHTPPQHLPPAKRQRFDGPNQNQNHQHQHRPPPPQFQPPPQLPQIYNQGSSGNQGGMQGHSRGGVPPAGPHMPMGGASRGTAGNRGGAGMGARGGRGGSMNTNRGGGASRGGRGGSSAYLGGGGGRGGGGGGGSVRGHGSRGNFGNKDYHSRRGGPFGAGGGSGGGGGGGYSHHQSNSSFRGRGPGQNSSHGGRHDGSGTPFAPREGTTSSSFSNAGKKDENRRTLTDFKIVGLEIKEIGWSWGLLPQPIQVKLETKEEPDDAHESSQVTVKEEAPEGDTSRTEASSKSSVKSEPDVESSGAEVALPLLETQPVDAEDNSPVVAGPSSSSIFTTPPPSRIRIYFHTPVTADDSHPIPHASYSLNSAPSDSRKGKRKKLDDDDGELEEGRAPPPPPRMGSGLSDGRSSAAPSAAPSIAETASEADWLMAAIVQDEDHGDVDADDNGDGDEDEDDQLHVSQIVDIHGAENAATDGGADTDNEGNDMILDKNVHHEESDVAKPELSENLADGTAVEATGTTGAAENTSAEPLEGVHLMTSSGVDDSGSLSPVGAGKDGAVLSSDLATADLKSDEGATLLNDGGMVPPGLLHVSSRTEGHDLSASFAVQSNEKTALNPSESSLTVELQSADYSEYSDPQITPKAKSLQAVSSVASTIIDLDSRDAPLLAEDHDGLVNSDVHEVEAQSSSEEALNHVENADQEHLPEPPASPASNTLVSTSSNSTHEESPPKQLKPDGKGGRTPSANRLSISYAGGNRRLLVDAEVVRTLKVFRQDGRIEVQMDIESDGEDGLKGILIEGLSEETKLYLPLTILSPASEPDSTLPPFSTLAIPSTINLIVHLDTERPLSEPKWAKSGDVQEWLKSMFGRMFWVAGDAAEGWEKKILVVDPDPPPTIWTLLEGWAVNSPVGALNERQRFLKTHMSDNENILEVLLRLVRGERATPFSQSAPSLSAPSVSGPLLSALSQGSAHGSQQTHVSLAVLAMFCMTVEYAQKAIGDAAKAEVDERMGEIIRCLPSHLIYKSVDGMFKEWRVDKKGR